MSKRLQFPVNGLSKPLALVFVILALIGLALLLQQIEGPPAGPQSTGVFPIPLAGEQVTVNGIVAGTGRAEDNVFAFYVERSAEMDAVAIRTSGETMLYAGKFVPRRFIEGDVVEGDSVEVEAVSDGTRLTALIVKRFRDADE
mgnify:CR=1 FL=1